MVFWEGTLGSFYLVYFRLVVTTSLRLTPEDPEKTNGRDGVVQGVVRRHPVTPGSRNLLPTPTTPDLPCVPTGSDGPLGLRLGRGGKGWTRDRRYRG